MLGLDASRFAEGRSGPPSCHSHRIGNHDAIEETALSLVRRIVDPPSFDVTRVSAAAEANHQPPVWTGLSDCSRSA